MSGNNQRRNRNANNSGRRNYQGGSGPRNNSRDRGGNNYRDNKYRDDDRSVNATRVAINPWQTGTAPMLPQFQTFQAAPMMIQQGIQRVDMGNQGFRAGYGSGQPAKMTMGGMGFNAGPMIGVQNAPSLMAFQPQQQHQQLPQQQQQRSRMRDLNSPRNNNSRNRSPQGFNRNENRNSAYYGRSRSSNMSQDKKRQRTRTTSVEKGFHPKSRSRSRSRDIKDRLGKKESEGTGNRRRLSNNSSRKRQRRGRSPPKDSDKNSSKTEDTTDVPDEDAGLDEVGESVDIDGKEKDEATEVNSEKEESKTEETIADAEEDVEDVVKEEKEERKRSRSKERTKEHRPKDKRWATDDFPSEALTCHICDLHVFTSKTGFIRHLQGVTHEKMAKLYHAKNAAKLELLDVTVKLIEMRQRDKILRETGNRRPTIKKTIEHDLMRQLVKPRYCCDTKFNSPFDAEEHKLTIGHLRNEFEREGKKSKKPVVEAHDYEEADSSVETMIEEAKMNAKLCPINLEEPPIYDPSEAFGLEFLSKSDHYHCSLCDKNSSPRSVMMHCQSLSHYEAAMNHFRNEREKQEKEEKAKRRAQREEEEGKEKEKDADLDSIEKNVLEDFVKEEAVNEENVNNTDDGSNNEMQDDDYGDINEDEHETGHENFGDENYEDENIEEDDENLHNDEGDENKSGVDEEDDYEYNYDNAADEVENELNAQFDEHDDENGVNLSSEINEDQSIPAEEEEEDQMPEGSEKIAEFEEKQEEIVSPRASRRKRGRPSLTQN